MAAISCAIDVARPPDEVFNYVTDPTRFAEWQKNVVDGHLEADGPYGVGTKCLTVRRVGFAQRPVTSEVIRLDPPRRWAVQGVDGPIRAIVDVTVEPLDASTRSRLTIAIDFEGRGMGRLLVPLIVRREARAEIPANLQALKRRLEEPGDPGQ